MPELHDLEAAVGYVFIDKALLARACTHSSRSRDNYERLEFLGDRVLGLVLAEWLCETRPEAAEGEMAKSLAALAARESLTEVAREIPLGPYLKLSSGDDSQRDNATILSDVCEAVIGALYLDGGLDPARRFIRGRWQGLMTQSSDMGDAKTRLQEWSQGRQLGLPHYEVTERSGPDHAPNFVVQVRVSGLPPQRGDGASKRVAERAAAEAMCKLIGMKS